MAVIISRRSSCRPNFATAPFPAAFARRWPPNVVWTFPRKHSSIECPLRVHANVDDGLYYLP